MDNILKIVSKVEENHNKIGLLYAELVKSILVLKKIHDSQITRIEELELEAITSKVKIEIIKRSQSINETLEANPLPEPSPADQPTPKIQPPQIPSEPITTTPKKASKRPGKNPGSKFPQSDPPSKQKPGSSCKTKVIKTQSKLHSFITVKENPVPVPVKVITQSKPSKLQIDSRIIIDEDGFRLLDYKKLNK